MKRIMHLPQLDPAADPFPYLHQRSTLARITELLIFFQRGRRAGVPALRQEAFMRKNALFAVVILLFAPTACGGDPSPSASDEASRDLVISELRYAPRETLAGAPTTVVGSIRFEEADAEVTELAIEITPPGASRPTAYPPSALPIGQGVGNGTVDLAVSFVPPVAGDYTFAVRAVDAKGHASNPLTGSIHAR